MHAEITFKDRQGTEIAVSPGERGFWTLHLMLDHDDAPLPAGTRLEVWRDAHKFWLAMCKQTHSPDHEDFVWLETRGDFEARLTRVQSHYKHSHPFALEIVSGTMEPGDELVVHVGQRERRDLVPVVVQWLHPVVHYAFLARRPGEAQLKELAAVTIHVEAGAPVRLAGIVPSVVAPGEAFELFLRWDDRNCAPTAAYEGPVSYRVERLRVHETTQAPGSREGAEQGGELNLATTGTQASLEAGFHADQAGGSSETQSSSGDGAAGTVHFTRADRGTKIVPDLHVETPGVYRFVFEVPREETGPFPGWSQEYALSRAASTREQSGSATRRARSSEFSSNAFVVVADPPTRLYWADMHTHTKWKDGTGDWEWNYRYARDVAHLDVYSESCHIVTPRQYQGPPVVQPDHAEAVDPAWYWAQKQRFTKEFYAPGKFVTILGYEWTPSRNITDPRIRPTGIGDHNFYFLDPDAPLICRRGLEDTLDEIRAHERAFGIPHVGGRIPTLFYEHWDQATLPLVEIESIHGRFEYFYQEALDRGYRMRVCAMADGHLGNPGLHTWVRNGRSGIRPRTFAVASGLTGCFASRLTREAIWESLVAGQTYATSGTRALVLFRVNDAVQGTEMEAPHETFAFHLHVAHAVPVDRVDLVCGAWTIASTRYPPTDPPRRAVVVATTVPAAQIPWHPHLSSTATYARVTFRDGHVAWSSPVWLVPPARFTSSQDTVEEDEGDHAGHATQPPVVRYDPWYAHAWPPLDLAEPLPQDVADEARARFHNAIQKWGLPARLRDLEEYGFFRDYRGAYLQYRGYDVLGNFPTRLSYYHSFEDDRLYAAYGWNDWGVYDRGFKPVKWRARRESLDWHVAHPDDPAPTYLGNSLPPVGPAYREYFRPEIFLHLASRGTVFLGDLGVTPEVGDIVEELHDLVAARERGECLYFGFENYDRWWFLGRLGDAGWRVDEHGKNTTREATTSTLTTLLRDHWDAGDADAVRE